MVDRWTGGGAAGGAGNFDVFYRAPQLAQSYATAFWRLYGLARR